MPGPVSDSYDTGKEIVLSVRIWTALFTQALRWIPPGDPHPMSVSDRVTLRDDICQRIRPHYCAVPDCVAIAVDSEPFDLCRVHGAALRLGELIEVRDKCNDATCSIEEVRTYLIQAVEIAKTRIAAAAWN